MPTPSTPYLTIDLALVERNISRLADFGKREGIGIRPHTKTHKSLDMARRQLEAGAVGLTVAKVGEAEVMVFSGADVLVAYPLVHEAVCARIAYLARENSVKVIADSKIGVQQLALAAQKAGVMLDVLIDLDIGMHRTGVQSPNAALELGQFVDSQRGLRVVGIMCYPGHVWNRSNEQAEPLAAIAELLEETKVLFEKSGISTAVISGGSTPSAFQSNLIPQLTEIRPGTYIYNDMNTVRGGFCSIDDCAARVVCTVVSTAVPGQIVIDGGSKTFTTDRCIPAPDSGFGYIVEYPQARITAYSEEHGQVDVTACDSTPQIGERVTIIPNHVCPCVNLHDAVWLKATDGSLNCSPVDTRGRIS